MNACESENYLAISRSSSPSKSVEIFWAEIYRVRLIFRAESSLIQSQTPDSFCREGLNKGKNKITELRAILQRESQNS
jgi:hypothetical protein